MVDDNHPMLLKFLYSYEIKIHFSFQSGYFGPVGDDKTDIHTIIADEHVLVLVGRKINKM